MRIEIKIPPMGESITEVTIGTLLKPEGSTVKRDEELLEIETEKVNQLLYAQDSGTVHYSVKTGDNVKIGQQIAFIETGAGAATSVQEPKQSASREKATESTIVEATPAKKSVTAAKESPVGVGAVERKSAADFVEEVRKSEQVKVKEDTSSKEVLSSVATQTPSESSAAIRQDESMGRPEHRKRMSRLRQVIAKRLLEAQHTTAMLTTFNEVDMTAVLEAREKYKETFQKQHGVRLGFMSFFVKAAVDAMKAFPELNAYIDGNEIVYRDYFDLGIAISSDRGLVVPVVRNCDRLTFPEIEQAIETYAKKAKEGNLSLDELKGAGFTISNGGVFGSLLSTPIINPPQSGILGMHRIQKRPVVVNDEIVIRSMMYLALSYDHRIVDGKEAISFLVTMKNCLEDPTRILLDL